VSFKLLIIIIIIIDKNNTITLIKNRLDINPCR